MIMSTLGPMIAVLTLGAKYKFAQLFLVMKWTFLFLLFVLQLQFYIGILNGYEFHLMPIVHCTVVEENC